MVAIGTNNLGAAMSIQNTVDGIRAVVEVGTESKCVERGFLNTFWPRAFSAQCVSTMQTCPKVNVPFEYMCYRVSLAWSEHSLRPAQRQWFLASASNTRIIVRGFFHFRIALLSSSVYGVRRASNKCGSSVRYDRGHRAK